MADALDCIDHQISEWMYTAKTPGTAVAWIEAGRPVHVACFGKLSRDGAAVTPRTIFEAASLGKPIFACAALLLAAEGKLDLDAPLSAFLPDPWVAEEPRLAGITARRVLSHSSGLPNWFRDGAPRKLVFSPGDRFGYSGEGYFYLQRVIETLTSVPLETWARDQIFAPLRMFRSRYSFMEEYASETAQGHDAECRPLEKWKPWPNAGTSLHTTIEDYARFVEQMVGSNTLLPLDVRRAMFQPETWINDTTAWGLGWGLKRIQQEWLFWQWGDNDGWKHFAAGSPARGEGVCVLTNGENGWQVWSRIVKSLLDPEGEIQAWLSTI